MEFLAELDLLFRAAGRPSYRRISTEIRGNNAMPDTVSHETVGAILRGDLARWSKVESVVRYLAATAVHHPNVDDEVRRFHALWSDAVDSRQGDRPNPTRHTIGGPNPPAVPPHDDPLVSPPSQNAAPGPAGMIGHAPQRNPGFTGRRELLKSMAANVEAEPWRTLVLYGLGGVGKTQLAAEFLYRNAHRYDFVGWIPAEDPSQTTAAVAALAERLDWPVWPDMAQTVRTVLARLERSTVRWLIIYDNAREPDDIEPLLPQAGGALIVTTRDAAWLDLGRPIEVDVFARAESVELLSARCHEITSAEADQLADRLGDLPLALEQVAAMQSVTKAPIRNYLQQFDERALEFLGSSPPGDYRTTVATSFTMAAEQIRRESPATAQLLELICCLGAEPISLTVLRRGGRQIAAPLGRLLSELDAHDEAIRRLRRYGLVKTVDDGQAVQVHRLVQTIVRDAMPAAERREAYANACRVLAAANPGRPTDPLTWDMYMRIGPHLRPARVFDVMEPDVRQLLIDQAEYLNQVGDFEGSRRLSEDALAAWDQHGVTGDEQVAFCLRCVVAALFDLGRHDEAFQRADEAYAQLVAHPDYGSDHNASLALANIVAVLSRVSGDYEKALARDQSIVKSYQRTHDREAGLTIDARNNLAASLRATGDFRAASGIDAELVEICRSKYGPDHQRTLLSVSNHARDLYGLGHYSAALDLQRSVWDAHRDRLGDRHPLVLAAWRTIVLGLRKTGQIHAAQKEARRLHLTCLAYLGGDNRMTLAAMMTYANSLCAVGEVYQAFQLAGDAVDLHRRIYGERNPFTLVAAANQAIILRAVGERRRARSVGEASFRALQQRLGIDHPYAIAAAVGFGNDLVLAHEEEFARRLLAGTLEDSRRVRGETHPDTLLCAVNLGLQLSVEQPGDDSLLTRSIDALRRALGDNHPLVMAAVAGRPVECDIEPPPV